MGEWLLPVGVSKRKSKISLLRLVGGGARAVLFTKSRSLSTSSLLVKEKKTFALSDIISFCKAEDGHHQKDLIFQQLQGPGSHGAGDGEWVSLPRTPSIQKQRSCEEKEERQDSGRCWAGERVLRQWSGPFLLPKRIHHESA